jgi:PAS domain S-box-containing protein
MGLFSRGKNTGKDGGKISGSLRDEKQKAAIIVNSIDDAVVLIDKDNVIQNFNPAAELLTGWDVDEASGIDYRSVIKIVNEKGQPYPDADHPFYKVFQEKKPIRDNEATFVKKDSSTVSVDVSVSPLLDEQGLISGAVGVFRNVDEQRKQEKQRADFISTASHEMRTPVAAIEGYLALAMNDKVCQIDAKARGFLEKAHSSTSHLGKLFQDLLTSAKAEDGRLTSHPTVIDMSEFTEKLVEDLRFSAEKKGLLLELLSSSGKTESGVAKLSPIYYVHVDPDRLREVVTNLFDNAVKYTEAGKISIGVTGDQNVVQFRIQDTGAGIPKEDLPHLFQKFYRVDNSSTRTVGGTGLGLFISRKIVELYNGKIWAESEAGKGSTFFINLPRLSAEKAAQLSAEQPTLLTPTTKNV